MVHGVLTLKKVCNVIWLPSPARLVASTMSISPWSGQLEGSVVQSEGLGRFSPSYS